MTVRLFGGLQVWRGRQPVRWNEWRTEKNRVLLAVLVAARGKLVTDEQLVECLWPERSPVNCRTSLRKRISELRRILEPDLDRGQRSRYIATRREGYCLAPEAPCWVDVEAFVAKRAEGEKLERMGNWAEAIGAYQEAVALYGDGYLPEFRYAEWALPVQLEKKAACLDVLSRLAECAARIDDRGQVIISCQQVLRLEPCNEQFLRTLMETHILEDQPAMALLAYEHCATHIDRRLGTEPSAHLQEFYARIRARMSTTGTKGLATARTHPHELEHSPLVGRERELARLRARTRAAAQGRGGTILISGVPGIGKSTLVQEALAEAVEGGRLVLTARCSAHGSLEHEPLLQAIRDALPQLSGAHLVELPTDALSRLVQLVPELRNLVHDVPPAKPPPEAQLREWTVEALVQFLAGLAGCGAFVPPTVVFLDDLHHMTLLTAKHLALLSRRIADCPVLIVGAACVEPKGCVPALKRLRQAPEVQVLPLGPLEAPAVRALLGQLLSTLGEGLWQELFSRSKGHPMLLVSLLRALVADRTLEQGVDGTWVLRDVDWEMLICGLGETVEDQLSQLGEDELAVLRALTVLGVPACPELLHGMWPDDKERLDQSIERLVEGCLVQLDGRGRYAIPHEVVRRCVAAGLRETEARVLHRRAAHAIESLAPTVWWSGMTARAAHHFFEAGLWAKALACSLDALRRAEGEYRTGDALCAAQLALKAAENLGPEESTLERLEILRLCSRALGLLSCEEDAGREVDVLDASAELHEPG